MYRESINPTSIPLPPVWQPHPALRLLNQTIALVASFDLPPAQFTALLDSIMSVHDLIAIEDEGVASFSPQHPRRLVDAKIGRASCRERVS